MNIQVYDWEIKKIEPLLGDHPDERRVKITTRDATTISIFLSTNQIEHLTGALEILYRAPLEAAK